MTQINPREIAIMHPTKPLFRGGSVKVLQLGDLFMNSYRIRNCFLRIDTAHKKAPKMLVDPRGAENSNFHLGSDWIVDSQASGLRAL
ncbi:MAG: hypothetical protein CMJ60_08685 [Planctomycetaceae bacterium]|nr:hypothetical protein [Planctomycetaceae bacterium]